MKPGTGTGLLDTETIIKKNMINMEERIQTDGSALIKEIINTNKINE